MIDAESQSFNLPNKIVDSSGGNGDMDFGGGDEGEREKGKTMPQQQQQYAPLPPKCIMLFFMGTTFILFVTCLMVLFHPAPMELKHPTLQKLDFIDVGKGQVDGIIHDEENDVSFSATTTTSWWSWFGMKKNVNKKWHHANVQYSTYNDKSSRLVYKREFTIPCNDGVLVFNIGPAPSDQDYDFEIYDDAYLWSNNNNLCFWYPYWQAFQLWHHPFWNPTDPMYQSFPHVSRDQLNRISTKINTRKQTKPIDDQIRAKGGDYAIFGRGKFWDPNYWDSLHKKVHSWKKDTMKTQGDIDAAVQQWIVEELIVE